jgi:CheY-like chemotaxis protein
MPNAAPRRVLVVDDDPDIRAVLAEMLGATGYDVSTARDGREALQLLRAERFGLVVLDLMMPVMTGWEFREAQLGDPRISHVPVIVVSAARSPRKVDAAAFLPKPFDLDDLLALTARLVH